ncbi:MAG: hypothetical protein H0W78_05195 [Planctomycetes bacterium]|jgi:hypothetical protein|nr:hypothetical protein [Planctomycetota bacterium]
MTSRHIEVVAVVASLLLAPVEAMIATTRHLANQPITSDATRWWMYAGYFFIAAVMNWLFIKLWRSRRSAV